MQWSCPACTYKNPETFLRCEICGAQRPAPAETAIPIDPNPPIAAGGGERWSCPACTFSNNSILTACSLCQTPRPGSRAERKGETKGETKGRDRKDTAAGTGAATTNSGPDAATNPGASRLSHGAHGARRGIKWRRNRTVVGTTDTQCFQKSLARPEADPLQVRRMARLGYCCIPTLGVYDADYTIFHPRMLLEMPADNLHLVPMGRALQNALYNHARRVARRRGEPVPARPGDAKARQTSDDGGASGEAAVGGSGDAVELTAAERHELEFRFSDSDQEEPVEAPSTRARDETKAEWHHRHAEFRNWNLARIRRAMDLRQCYYEWDKENKHSVQHATRTREQKWRSRELERKQRVGGAETREEEHSAERDDTNDMGGRVETDDEYGGDAKVPPRRESGVDARDGGGGANPHLGRQDSEDSAVASEGAGEFWAPLESEFYIVIHQRVDEKKCGAAAGDVAAAPHPDGKSEDPAADGGVRQGWRINAVPHMWTFPDCAMDVEDNEMCDIRIGVFDAHGLVRNQGTLSECLLPGRMRTQNINIHDQHFSPNNCAITIDPTQPYASFFMLCTRRNRRVLSYHVLPIQRGVADRVGAVLGQAQHLEVVLSTLEADSAQPCRALAERLGGVIKPFLGF